MPLLLIFLGLLFVVAAYQNNIGAVAIQLETDVAGWFKWGIAIIAIGILQYIPGFERPARVLMGLVVVVVILTQGKGFFQQLQAASAAFAAGSTAGNTSQGQAGTAAQATISAEKQASALAGGGGGGSSGGGGAGGMLGSLGGIASAIGSLFG